MSEAQPTVPLSETELAILKLVATGATNREIAHARSISEATVKKHLTNINGKLGTGNRTEAMRRSLEAGLISVSTPDDNAADAARESAREDDQAETRRLAEALAQSHRRSRQLSRGIAFMALAITALMLALAWNLSQADLPPAPAPATAVPLSGPQWNPGGRLPSARDGLALVYADGLYAIAGEDEDGLLGDMLQYRRGIVQEWARLPGKPTPVRDVAAVAVQGFIVVPGGCLATGKATDKVEIYDTEKRRWLEGPALPEPVCAYALAYLPARGRIYIFGGRSQAEPGSATDAVWSHRLGDADWQSEPRMARPRAFLAAAVIDDEVHLMGGEDEAGRPQQNHWIFRPFATQAWLEDAGDDLPSARSGHVAIGISTLRRIYLVGGSLDRDEPAALALDVGSGEGWEAFTSPRLQTPRQGASVAIKHDGLEIWLAGGRGIEGARLNNTYVFNQTPLFELLNRVAP
jgi:DNA-binding CsgD family transcriptional regulator/N-acetylneuraminic acid mutarotase